MTTIDRIETIRDCIATIRKLLFNIEYQLAKLEEVLGDEV